MTTELTPTQDKEFSLVYSMTSDATGTYNNPELYFNGEKVGNISNACLAQDVIRACNNYEALVDALKEISTMRPGKATGIAFAALQDAGEL